MFIVKKKISGKEYFYLQKSVRENGKVVSKCIAYLGKDREEAERKAKEIEAGIVDDKSGKDKGVVKVENLSPPKP